MKRIALVLFLSALPVTGCFSQTIDQNTWDFGQIKAGDVVKHSFVLKNNSAKVLKINGINTSCGCTGSKTDKNQLAPGESANIEVQFNSKNYNGPIQQFVYVNTDNVDNPIIRYIIKAEVIK